MTLYVVSDVGLSLQQEHLLETSRLKQGVLSVKSYVQGQVSILYHLYLRRRTHDFKKYKG